MMEPMSNLEMALQNENDPQFVVATENVGSGVKFQSDHNAVYGYFPNLIDGKYNVAIFTYNEKGNTCDLNGVTQFLKDCAGLGSADIIIAGIQEGDPKQVFINTIRNYKKDSVDINVPGGVFTHSAGIKVGELDWALTDEMEWDNTGILGGGGELVRQAVYKSLGKECRGKGSLLCLVNGIYVIIPEKSRLVRAGNNVPLIIQTGVNPVNRGYSKHMAWACIDTERSQTVFFSCHLEYSGDAKHVESGYKFSARANQLDGYLAELTAKFPGAGAYICLGDTNMRTLLRCNTNCTAIHLVDQMMYYLLQVSQRIYNNDNIINKYPPTPDVDKKLVNTVANRGNLIKYIFDNIPIINQQQVYLKQDTSTLFNMRLVMINNLISIHTLPNVNAITPITQDSITKFIGEQNDTIPSQLFKMLSYATKDGIADDPYAGYCLNPEFNINGTEVKYRAYDFTYKPIVNQNPNEATILQIYSYGPTAIFTPNVIGMDGSREFDSDKRAKSGGLLGPSHTDRILMFVPKLDKIKFINLAM